jgi:hypothetical protein
MARLLHFTDMHLRINQPGTASDPLRLSRSMPSALDRLAGRIKEITPDVLVMSGDLLDVPDEVKTGGTPDDRSHEEWVESAKADFQLIRDWFDATAVPYVVVPGNHDLEGAFADVFEPPPKPRDIAGFRFFCFWDELADDKQPLRTGTRKEQFEDALNNPDHDCPQIHVQHYMIDPPTIGKGKRYEYKTADPMKDALKSSDRVRAILSGHYHPGSMVTTDGVIHSLPPAFCEAPHAFRVYDLSEDGSNTITDHALDI